MVCAREKSGILHEVSNRGILTKKATSSIFAEIMFLISSFLQEFPCITHKGRGFSWPSQIKLKNSAIWLVRSEVCEVSDIRSRFVCKLGTRDVICRVNKTIATLKAERATAVMCCVVMTNPRYNDVARRNGSGAIHGSNYSVAIKLFQRGRHKNLFNLE